MNVTEVHYRIGSVARLGLVITAGFFDFLQMGTFLLNGVPSAGPGAALVLGWVIFLMGILPLSLFFLLNNVPVLFSATSTGPAVRFFIMTCIEVMPIVSVTPTLTWWAWNTISNSRKEDRKRVGILKDGGRGLFSRMLDSLEGQDSKAHHRDTQ